MNWRARPLLTHEVVVNTSVATTTSTGLTVRAVLNESDYPAGANISDTHMRQLATDGRQRHDWHTEWNYTLHQSRPTAPVAEAAQADN